MCCNCRAELSLSSISLVSAKTTSRRSMKHPTCEDRPQNRLLASVYRVVFRQGPRSSPVTRSFRFLFPRGGRRCGEGYPKCELSFFCFFPFAFLLHATSVGNKLSVRFSLPINAQPTRRAREVSPDGVGGTVAYPSRQAIA